MIKIITDSTAYLPKDFVKKHDITVIRLHSIVGEKDFVEGYPESYKEIYDEIKKTNILAKTSQPAIGEFIDAYNKVIKDGNEAIVLTISEILSGTANTAKLAGEQCDDPSKIVVIDSGSTGQTIFGEIIEVINLINEGKNIKQIENLVNYYKQNSGIAFVPNSLDYLKRGGRIGTLTSIIGTILHIKPIIAFRNSKLEIYKKPLGISKAIQELIGIIPENAIRIFIIKTYGCDEGFYNKLKEQTLQKFPKIEWMEGEIGPVVASHVGPAFGLSWIALPAYSVK